MLYNSLYKISVAFLTDSTAEQIIIIYRFLKISKRVLKGGVIFDNKIFRNDARADKRV